LDDASRRQLQQGLTFARDHDYELAVPLLVLALEGPFWQLAVNQGLVAERGDAVFLAAKVDPNERKVTSVTEVLDLPQLSLDSGLRRFVRGLPYGRGVHRVRHGRAREGWRRRGLFLIVALAGWLEHHGGPDGNRLLQDAFVARTRRLGEGQGEDGAGD
jgi:hypothetical protein